MIPTGNLRTLWRDALQSEAIPVYPRARHRIAEGGEPTYGWDSRYDAGVQVLERPAERGELLRDARMRYLADDSENLAFRGMVAFKCGQDPEYREMQRVLCKSDVLYFINVFCWTFDPRIDDDTRRICPFVTYEFQDDLITWIIWLIRNKDTGLIEKSRDQGMTWVFIAVLVWLAIFYEYTSALLTSQVEDDVDNRTPKSLFGKVRIILQNLPPWLRAGWQERVPGIDTQMLINFPDTHSTLEGAMPRGTAGRQGRYTLLFADEFSHIEEDLAVQESFASLAASKFFGSTPNGMGNEFARMAHLPNVKKKRLHWSLHPLKNADWYLKEKNEPGNTDEVMAQEHEIAYEKSTIGRVFPQFKSSMESDWKWCHIQEGLYYEYDPAYEVFTASDLGISDPTHICFAQVKPAPPEFHMYTKAMLLFFAEFQSRDMTAYDLRYYLNSQGYRYADHVVDPRTGGARDGGGKTWIQRLAERDVKPLRSDVFKCDIDPGPPVICSDYGRNDWFEPVECMRNLLGIPGAVAWNRLGAPLSIQAMQNWGFKIDPQTRKPVDGDSRNDPTKHDQFSHPCKAMVYQADHLYERLGRQRAFRRRVQSQPIPNFNFPTAGQHRFSLPRR